MDYPLIVELRRACGLSINDSNNSSNWNNDKSLKKKADLEHCDSTTTSVSSP